MNIKRLCLSPLSLRVGVVNKLGAIRRFCVIYFIQQLSSGVDYSQTLALVVSALLLFLQRPGSIVVARSCFLGEEVVANRQPTQKTGRLHLLLVHDRTCIGERLSIRVYNFFFVITFSETPRTNFDSIPRPSRTEHQTNIQLMRRGSERLGFPTHPRAKRAEIAFQTDVLCVYVQAAQIVFSRRQEFGNRCVDAKYYMLKSIECISWKYNECNNNGRERGGDLQVLEEHQLFLGGGG